MRWRLLKTTCPHFSKIFCTCYLWPWLSPPLTTLPYVMYFRFSWMTSCFSHNGSNGPTSRTTLCFVQFARWRHRAKSAITDFILFPQKAAAKILDFQTWRSWTHGKVPYPHPKNTRNILLELCRINKANNKHSNLKSQQSAVCTSNNNLRLFNCRHNAQLLQ